MASKLMPSLLLIVLAWIILASCPAATDQKDVLSKLDELQETINGLTDMTSSKKKEIAGKVGKIFNVIRYFKAGGEYTGAGIFKTVEVLGDLLEVSGVLSTGLPWMGPLISQICSGVIHVFYNPSSGDIFVNKLREQYMKELKDDGAGVFEVLTSLDMELRFIQDKVSEGTPWDEVAKSTFKSLQDRAR